SGPPNSDVLACKTVTCDRLLREQADVFSPARHGLNADSSSGSNLQLLRLWSTGWLGSAGHPQDIAQCRRVVGALRIGAAASPRGVFEYTTAHVNSVSQLQLRLSWSRSPSTTNPSCPQYLLAAHPSRPSCLPPPPSTSSLPPSPSTSSLPPSHPVQQPGPPPQPGA
ncbi:hypothetical protein QJQ45_016743, partial [Haematococcus lacustris]